MVIFYLGNKANTDQEAKLASLFEHQVMRHKPVRL